MRAIWAISGALALWTAAAGAGELVLTEDPPVVPPPKAGAVEGTITPAREVLDVKAVSRVTNKTYAPVSFDGITGKFLFKNLPGDAAYDLCIRTRDRRSLEGIDLGFFDDRLIRLAAKRRKQLGIPPEAPYEFLREDANSIVEYCTGLKDFMDARRVLFIRGHGRRATALIEAVRTRDFYAKSGSQIIWRIELWYFENQYGGWDQLADTARVLHRRRSPFGEIKAISLEYFPELSVRVRATGRSEPVRFKIPAKRDPSRGRVPGGTFKLKSNPHVLGLAAKAAPTTQPTSRKATTRPAPATSRPAAR